MKPAALAALLLGSPALAQEHPLTVPTRDVDVTYAAVIGGQPVEQRSRFAAGRIRIDTPSPGLYVLVDRQARTMRLVSQGDRSVLEMPYRPEQAVGGVPADRSFVRGGEDVVSGTPCREWDVLGGPRQAVTLCVTDDGVLLRVRSGATVLVQATRVSYAPIDPSVFSVPAGFVQREAQR